MIEEAKGAMVVKSEVGHTAALDPALDDELREEGLARELVNRIQRLTAWTKICRIFATKYVILNVLEQENP